MLSISISNTIGARPVGIDAQAQAHYNRVIADGGIVPAGVSGVNAFFNAVKAIYATTDITTAVSVGVDAHYLGYKLGAGSGATLGQAVQKLYSCAGSSGDVVQTTAASQPLLLAHNGASTDNYYYAPGVSGNYISTTSTYQNDDWDVEFNVKGKYSLSTGRIAGTRSVGDGTNVAITPTRIEFEYVVSSIIYLAFASTTNTNDVEYTVRVTRNAATGAVTFIKNGVTLTTAGSQIAGALASSSYAIQINGVLGGVQGITGNINWVKFYTSGSVVRYFNPASYNAATSQTQWTSTTGEVWTINTGTAASGYKGVLVDRTIMQSDGVDDTMQSSTITSRSNFTRYFAFNTIVAANTQYFIDGDTTDKHLIYKGSSLLRLYNSGTGAGEITTSNTVGLKLITGDYNTSSSKLRANAEADTNGTVGNATSTKVTLFAAGSGSTYSNIIVTTVIDSNSISNNTIKTAMYNYIRSLNNNAF